MTTHIIYSPTNGKQTERYVTIPDFVDAGNTPYQRIVVPQMRMVGKASEYVRAHALAKNKEDSNFNGYGYADHTYRYLLRYSDAIAVKHMLEERVGKKKVRTEEENVQTWVRQMSKYVDTPDETLEIIAREKLGYKAHQIQELEERQQERGYSVRRQVIIDRVRRSNPLRRVESPEHANRILAAHNRHTQTNYEAQLTAAHRKEWWGDMVPGQAREYARTTMTHHDSMQPTTECKEEVLEAL